MDHIQMHLITQGEAEEDMVEMEAMEVVLIHLVVEVADMEEMEEMEVAVDQEEAVDISHLVVVLVGVAVVIMI